jgi:hypothetical protein
VIAPARTGSDNNSSRTVMAIDHTNNGIRSGFILFGFILIVVAIKFTAPKMAAFQLLYEAYGASFLIELWISLKYKNTSSKSMLKVEISLYTP